MVDPVTMSTIMSAVGKGMGQYSEHKKEKRKEQLEKDKLKEHKRKTLAELLNASFNREFEAGEGVRKRGSDLASGRASAMQNIASQYVQALR